MKINLISRLVLFAALACLPCALARGELRADQIALIVNKNVPDGKILADFYVEMRKLPPDRIIEVDLPDADEISFEQYDRDVVLPVRQYLREHKLLDQIKCIVTMYGVPLRIANRTNTPAEEKELASLQAALVPLRKQVADAVVELEHRAMAEDPAFHAGSGDSLEDSTARLDRAEQSLIVSIQKTVDEVKRQAKLHELTAFLQQFHTPVSTALSDPPSTQPTTEPATEPTTQDYPSTRPVDLAERSYSAAARKALREVTAKSGLFTYARALEFQIARFATEQTGSALDSELALLWWTNYARAKWMGNPLSYPFLNRIPPPTMMTMRLDGPSPQIARSIIRTSIQVEHDGLKGGLAVDGGGSRKLDPEHKNPGFAQFDERLLTLAKWTRARAKIEVTYDSKPDVFPPNTVPDVALYAGWYSVRHYVPGCLLARGAVGAHYSSYEMTTLHANNSEEWCRGLLNSGAVATFGPVAEPYLGTFPLPDDFFPLLMTGKLTLAEVYWRTTPTASWQMCMVGDPLYMPYAAHPLVRISDLSPHLQAIFNAKPATGPAVPQR